MRKNLLEVVLVEDDEVEIEAVTRALKNLHVAHDLTVFRSGIDPVDLHMSISALSVFNVANRHTFALIFQRDLESPAAQIARRDSIIEMVVRFCRK